VSLCSNTTGDENVAIGTLALASNTTASTNTAVGTNALICNTTGSANTTVGKDALGKQTTGANNTSIGQGALNSVTSGFGNVAIGNDSGAQGAMIDITGEDNRAVFGHNSITNAYVKVAFTVTSDQRDKTNLGTVPHGLDFVNQLNPVSFQFKKSRDNDAPHGDMRYGFLAQDILALEGDNPVIIDNEFEDALKYKGEHLVPVLVNAIKELKAEIDELKKG
jgi:hypothetical protein